jgi:hypothetical protein
LIEEEDADGDLCGCPIDRSERIHQLVLDLQLERPRLIRDVKR